MKIINKIIPWFTIALVITITVYSCAHNPYGKTNREYRREAKAFAGTLKAVPPVLHLDSAVAPPYAVGTINFDMRKPNFVIIHHTAQNSCAQTLRTFTVPHSKVSAHYVICKDGTIHHMLNDYLRAWQAGNSRWGNSTDINSNSIGIELDNNGHESFAEPQVVSLLKLLDTLKKKYYIPAANFIGHGDIAPTRKVDPNVTFPWQRLAQRGFGLWYDDTTLVDTTPVFDRLLALRIIGYDLKDTTAAIRAYKRHFLQDTLSREFTPADDKILYQLMKKYR